MLIFLVSDNNIRLSSELVIVYLYIRKEVFVVFFESLVLINTTPLTALQTFAGLSISSNNVRLIYSALQISLLGRTRVRKTRINLIYTVLKYV